MRLQFSLARHLASVAVTAILAAGLGGCQTMSDVTGALTAKPETPANADPQAATEMMGDRYRANPKDAKAALAYGQVLRAKGQRAQAAALVGAAANAHPRHK